MPVPLITRRRSCGTWTRAWRSSGNCRDYFERKTSTTSSPVVSYCREQNIGYSGYQIDSIVTKTIIDPYHTQYTFLHTGVEDDHNYYLNTTSHSEIISHDTLTVDTTKFFDHLKMPEEYVDNCLYYFYPLDTIFCFSNASYLTLSEGTCCPYEKFYKTGLGQLMTVTDVYGKASCEDLLIAQINNSLVYVNKDGVSCGSYHSLSINNLEKNSGAFQLYPNPATTSLTITSTEKINQITINKLIGQTVYTHEYNTEKVQVDVSGLPNGIYFVKINGSEVRKFVKE